MDLVQVSAGRVESALSSGNGPGIDPNTVWGSNHGNAPAVLCMDQQRVAGIQRYQRNLEGSALWQALDGTGLRAGKALSLTGASFSEAGDFRSGERRRCSNSTSGKRVLCPNRNISSDDFE